MIPIVPAAAREDGFTLVELMVAILLSALVLSIVGGLMFSSQSTEVIVGSVTQATQNGTAVQNSIVNGIRNSESSLGTSLPFKLTVPATGDQMVTALVVGSGATATTTCQAWYFSSSTKSIRYKVSSSAIGTPNAAVLATWTLLSTGVTPISGSTIFSPTGTNGLSMAFNEAAGNDPAVPFQTSVYSRTGLTGTISCY
jgi:prepilin-type N-terminal cleavage/methylation domain-containing protein